MKFELILANDLCENYVLIYCWDSNLDLWNLIIAIVSLG